MTNPFIPIIIVVIVMFLLYYTSFALWITVRISGVDISLLQLFLIRLRNIPPAKIVNCIITAHKAGLEDVTINELEAHYLAGGNIENVVTALVMAKFANIDLTFKMATAFDLAGKDVVQAVKEKAKNKEKSLDISDLQ